MGCMAERPAYAPAVRRKETGGQNRGGASNIVLDVVVALGDAQGRVGVTAAQNCYV